MPRRLTASLVALALTCAWLVAASPAAEAAQPSTWHARQARISQAQPAGHGGKGVVVAVLDTWVERSHPDFGGRVLAGADCAGGTCKAGLAPPDECAPHGTHVAGTVASATYGVAPQATILPVRVLSYVGSECSADASDVARAVTWSVDHGADVINISLGTALPVVGQINDIAQAVDAASARGVIVVAAAGNEEAPVGDSYGTTALVTAATAPSGQLASYSQRGQGVDLAAPGGEAPSGTCDVAHCVVSTWSQKRFAALAGTSMAAPMVAGTAALLLGQRPGRGRDDVVRRLTSTAHPLAGAGAGLIDAKAALGVTGSAPTPARTSSKPAARTSTAPAVTTRTTPATARTSTPQQSATPRRTTESPRASASIRAVAATAPPVLGLPDPAYAAVLHPGYDRGQPVGLLRSLAGLVALAVGAAWLLVARQVYSR